MKLNFPFLRLTLVGDPTLDRGNVYGGLDSLSWSFPLSVNNFLNESIKPFLTLEVTSPLEGSRSILLVLMRDFGGETALTRGIVGGEGCSKV